MDAAHLTTLSATNMLWRISAHCLGGWVEICDQDKREISRSRLASQKTYPIPISARPFSRFGELGTAIADGTDFLISSEEI